MTITVVSVNELLLHLENASITGFNKTWGIKESRIGLCYIEPPFSAKHPVDTTGYEWGYGIFVGYGNGSMDMAGGEEEE